jgi:hypothetical protein
MHASCFVQGKFFALCVDGAIAYAGKMVPKSTNDHTLTGTANPAIGQFFLSLACILLALMPLAMWLANRSAPLFLCLSAFACLGVLWCEGWPLADKLRALRAVRSPATTAGGLVVALAAISMAWSHNPAASLFALGELLVPVASGIVVALVLPPRAPRWLAGLFAASLAMAISFTFIELHFNTGFRQMLGLRNMAFIFNRSLITAMLVTIPLVGWLLISKRPVAALAIGMLAAAAVMTSESGAARLGLAMAILAGGLALLAPRLSLIAACTGLAALLAFAPVQGEIAERLIPPGAHQQLQDSHSRDRVDIWLSFGEAIRARPLLGSGFGSSASLQDNPVAQEVQPQRRTLLAVGHPHSAQVQIWAELGLAGAMLMFWLGLSLVLALGKRSRVAVIAPLAAMACAVAIAAVGHGAWQGWWIAALASCIIWFRVFDAWAAQDIRARRSKLHGELRT